MFCMNKKLKEKIALLEPKTRMQIESLFENMNQSIALLYDIATTDEKTGLYNNKFFEATLEMELEKARRGQQRLSMMMIDIDFFKKVNDKYGHMKADELLEQLAKVIKRQIRKSDIAARFGGEEFIILLPETPLNKAKKLAARLREAIAKDRFLKKHGIKVSGGITEYRKMDNKKRMKVRVDKALYEAKETGRDKFVERK
jgi:diguanylate cyclase (GGDEF)-like protein